MAIRLLVIDDEEQLRKNLVDLLTLSGFAVASATNGRRGVALAHEHPPDLILCDIMMPQMDGYQVLESIRLNPALAHLPFVFLTAKADMVDLRRGMTLGADDYLTKPFLIKELLAVIETRLKRHRETLAPRSPRGFLKTIRGHHDKGTMILATEDCLYFFIEKRQCFVRHPLGTFQIDLSLDVLAAQLDPTPFFRVNRQVILHRKTVRHYTYWQNGKYCLFLELVGQRQETTLARARFGPFKHWLAGYSP